MKTIRFQGNIPCRIGDRLKIKRVLDKIENIKEIDKFEVLELENIDANCYSISRMGTNMGVISDLVGTVISSKIETNTIEIVVELGEILKEKKEPEVNIEKNKEDFEKLTVV